MDIERIITIIFIVVSIIEVILLNILYSKYNKLLKYADDTRKHICCVASLFGAYNISIEINNDKREITMFNEKEIIIKKELTDDDIDTLLKRGVIHENDTQPNRKTK